MSTELTARAEVTTTKPVPYMRQLCKHFGHKLDAEFGDDSGWIIFSDGRCDLRAADRVLELTVTAATADGREHVKRVVGSHLERFGRRDELTVSWDS